MFRGIIGGRYGGTTDSGYVEARILIPRFKVQASMSFMIDTGASRTMLSPADVERLNIDYAQLTGSVKSNGIGGFANQKEEPASVIFWVKEGFYVYRVNLCVPRRTKASMQLPSLLGRDVLNRMKMTYNGHARRLTFQVMTFDAFQPWDAI